MSPSVLIESEKAMIYYVIVLATVMFLGFGALCLMSVLEGTEIIPRVMSREEFYPSPRHAVILLLIGQGNFLLGLIGTWVVWKKKI